MVYIIFDKKTAGGAVKNWIMQNKELAEEPHKAIIINFGEKKVHSSVIDKIWYIHLADTQLLNKFLLKELRFLLCVVDICSKSSWVILLKDKKGIAITNALKKILDEPGHKPKKMWVDKDSEFYHRSVKSWLEKKCVEIYSTHNER